MGQGSHVASRVSRVCFLLGWLEAVLGSCCFGEDALVTESVSGRRYNPKHWEALLLLGRVQERSGDLEAAKNTFSYILLHNNSLPMAHFKLAQVHIRTAMDHIRMLSVQPLRFWAPLLHSYQGWLAG